MRAVCLLRDAVHYRKDAFCAGLKATGYEIERSPFEPEPGDLMVIWNRYGQYDIMAKHFEHGGGKVIVVENGHLGKGWHGGDYYSLAIGHHSGAGRWPAGGSQRWDKIGEEIAPWRETGAGAPLVLGQRAIGEIGIAAPANWAQSVHVTGARLRSHPGKYPPRVPLADDLARASCVITWHSSAALLALLAGVPVFHAFVRWIGAAAAHPLSRYPEERRDESRLAMFERLSWATWDLSEIRDGTAFEALRTVQ